MERVSVQFRSRLMYHALISIVFTMPECVVVLAQAIASC
jgi:hypothetical protein